MEEKKKLDKNYWVEPLRIFGRLWAWIIFPVVLGVLLGRFLDEKYNTSPRWFLIIVALSFVVSMAGLISNTLEEYKKIRERK